MRIFGWKTGKGKLFEAGVEIMTISSSQQMNVFLLSVLAGIACGVFFDFQRSLRRVYGAGMLHTAVQDIIFTLICVCAAIGVGFWQNKGQIRYFEIMGAAAGALVYFGTVSPFVLKLLCACHRLFVKAVIKPILLLGKMLLVPVKRLNEALHRFFAFLGVKMRAIIKKYRIRKKRLKKRMKML